MNNRTPRKILLGFLTTVVLAFSVHTYTDAQTLTRRASDDFESRYVNQTFDISFSVSDVASGNKVQLKWPTYLQLIEMNGNDEWNREGTSNNNSPRDQDLVLTQGGSLDVGAGQDELENRTYNLTFKVVNLDNDGRDGPLNVTVTPTDDNYGAAGALRYSVFGIALLDPTIYETYPGGPIGILLFDLEGSGAFPELISDNSDYGTYEDGDFVSNHEDTLLKEARVPILRGAPAQVGSPQIDETALINDAVNTSDPATGNLINTYHAASAHYGFPITYRVTSGPGQLYIKYNDSSDRPSRESDRATQLTTSSEATIWLDMNGGTNTIEAQPHVYGRAPLDTDKISFNVIFGYAQIQIVSGHSPQQSGTVNARLEDPFVIRLVDAANNPIRGERVIFDGAGEDITAGSAFLPVAGHEWFVVKDSAADEFIAASALTDSNGQAAVYMVLGDNASYDYRGSDGDRVKVVFGDTVVEQAFVPTVRTTHTDAVSIQIHAGDGQSAGQYGVVANPLAVIVRDGRGGRVVGEEVTFYSSGGTFDNGTNTTTSNTDATGIAAAYYTTTSSGQQSVKASIQTTSHGVQSVTFTINGTPAAGGGGNDGGGAADPAFSVTPTTITGAPGSTHTVTVNTAATNTRVTFGSIAFTQAGGTANPSVVNTGSGTSAQSTLTLPSTVGTYSLGITAGNDSDTVAITVAEPADTTPDPGTIRITTAYSGEVGSTASVTIQAFDADGGGVENLSIAVSVTNGGGTISPATVTTDSTGRATATLTRGDTPGNTYFVTATATDYRAAESRIQVTGVVVSAVDVYTGNNQRSDVNTPLANPLVVEVVGINDQPLADVRVVFEATTGTGTFSAQTARTDANGFAEVTFTPTSVGAISITASVTDADDTAVFNVTGTGETVPEVPDEPETPEVPEPSEPSILVDAAKRPTMYWLDNGLLVQLAGTQFHQIADNANGMTIANGKIYWTATTGNNTGSINSANLDGTEVTTLRAISSVPMGIAVDTAGSRLYWTNSRGKIQRANLNAANIQSFVSGLTNPADLVLNDGYLYWTENGDAIRRVNISGQKVVQDVAMGLGNVGGIAINDGKIYWTEGPTRNEGSINCSDLDGMNVQTLRTLNSAAIGISVDASREKLYWTNARGRVQSSDLAANRVSNVVTDINAPTSLLTTNDAVPAPAPDTPADDDTPADNGGGGANDYDVNNDGRVDNTDASLVSAALGTEDLRYDVNGDDSVDFLDLLLVFDHREDGAAGAPTVLGMQLTAVQRDNIQEQIDLLIATDDRSPNALRTLIYLQQLLVTARPDQTQLLANYPNPFNPETWIPYQLATDTDVKITIYTAQGVVIRSLTFGHQSAGYYTDRNRAAYWDGRNALGEPVSSGVYFYQLQTDDQSTLRKMVILK